MKVSKFLAFGPLFAALTALPLAAQTNQAPASADAAAKPAAGISDILKMLDAHVSPNVIKAYIETSPNSFDVTPADLITLKQHEATDEVTVALLKHGSSNVAPAASAAPAATPQTAAPIRAYVVNTGAQDPDSYQFFQRNYLMPRTQANINETLGFAAVPYGNTFAPYYPPGIYSYGFNSYPGVMGGVGFTAGSRNPFQVGPGLRGGFIVHR